MEQTLEVQGLEVKLRICTQEQIGFVYELMQQNLRRYFDQTPEGWSRQKFKKGFHPERITILEHNEMPVGFYDFELTGNFLYIHNVHLSHDYQNRGIGTRVISYLKETAQANSISHLRTKVFKENSRAFHWLQRCGFEITSELLEENSYLMLAEV
ncbi:MAG: GNAT family N-acetyltransferase [Candidatus Heimdallarchaeaceae archaeon]